MARKYQQQFLPGDWWRACSATFRHGLLVSANYAWRIRSIRMRQAAATRTIRRTPPACPASGLRATTMCAMYSPPTPSTICPSALESRCFSTGRRPRNPRPLESDDIVAARTGTPLNITYSRSSSSIATGYMTNARPNLVPGVSLTPPGGRSIRGTTENWINPNAFAAVTDPDSYGDTPRNLVHGPSLWQNDLGISNAFRSPSARSCNSVARLSTSSTARSTACRLKRSGCPPGSTPASIEPQVSTASTTPIGTGTPREIQFALRLDF